MKHESKPDPSPRLPRRTFMALAACTPVAALAGRPAPSLTAQPPAPLPAADPAPPASYRETEHARRYYRSAALL